MSNPSYDVDDILNEVRKRRQELENEIKGTPEPKAEVKEEAPDFTVLEKPVKEEPVPQPETTASKAAEVDENAEAVAEKAEDKEIDLLFLSESIEDPEPVRKSKAKTEDEKRRKKAKKIKIAFTVVIIVLAIALVGGAFAWNYINGLLDNAVEGDKPATSEEWHGMDKLIESFDPIYEDSSANISSYKQMVKKWYYNGTPASSTHVLNVLLIGEDTRDEEIEEESTRADSAIIASVNVDTGQIVLTSILRDAYCYWETVEGDESTGQYGKINGAMSVGGIDCYIRTVEHMYKINIDNYVIVNFNSFEKIVDTLGGVDVEMTQKEINEINNHQKRYNHVTIEGEPGLLHLDGRQALAYCRIRKIDSDNARADRQKTVLLELFTKMKTASSLKSIEVVTQLLPYVKTGFSKSEILSISKYALAHGWLQYQTQTFTVPNDEEAEVNEDGTTTKIKGCVGGTYYGAWIWKVDYPLYSQITQNRIYGKSNVELAAHRPKFDKIG